MLLAFAAKPQFFVFANAPSFADPMHTFNEVA
jgi:hypothetical protein